MRCVHAGAGAAAGAAAREWQVGVVPPKWSSQQPDKESEEGEQRFATCVLLQLEALRLEGHPRLASEVQRCARDLLPDEMLQAAAWGIAAYLRQRGLSGGLTLPPIRVPRGGGVDQGVSGLIGKMVQRAGRAKGRSAEQLSQDVAKAKATVDVALHGSNGDGVGADRGPRLFGRLTEAEVERVAQDPEIRERFTRRIAAGDVIGAVVFLLSAAALYLTLDNPEVIRIAAAGLNPVVLGGVARWTTNVIKGHRRDREIDIGSRDRQQGGPQTPGLG